MHFSNCFKFNDFEHNSCVSGLIDFSDEAFISCSYDKNIKVWISVKN